MDTNKPTTKKFIIFEIGGYWFVMPMTSVLKIVNCPPPSQGGTVGIGLVQLGAHTVRLLDLYQAFGRRTQVMPAEAPFLIVVRNPQKELWGIAVDIPPDLIELPLAIFKPVSLEPPFNDKTNWISHMAVISHKGRDRTLLLLDVHAIFQHGLEKPVR
ncbi:MAG: chemotaxis protein CheW [Cyanobacteria bacterium P01_C01_bin.118]